MFAPESDEGHEGVLNLARVVLTTRVGLLVGPRGRDGTEGIGTGGRAGGQKEG